MSPLHVGTLVILAEVLAENSARLQDVPASAATTCVSFFQKRDVGKSISERKLAIPVVNRRFLLRNR